jgi:peptidoglycan/LPS O-acetylase OafA/YrhL
MPAVASPDPPARPPGPDHGYYPLFDYLRIVLAVGVFASHADRFHLLPKDLGNACVQIFFALSGFLIGGILLASNRGSLPRFYYNRCTRIWIPYAIAIGLLLGATALRQRLSDPKLWEFFFYKATFVYNVFGPAQLATSWWRMPLQGAGNHFWSICVEEQFYLVAPFVIVFLPRGRLPILLAVVALNFVLPHAFTSVALGVLLALSRHRFGQWYLRPAGTLLVAAVLIAALLAVVRGWIRYPLGFPAVAVATVALLGRPGPQRGLGTLLGGMSYPFYLNHWIGLFLRNTIERHLHLGMLVGSLAALAIALAFSWLHYRAIDSVILRERSKWYTPRRGLRACVAGLSLVVIGLGGGLALHLRPPR